MPTLTTRSTIRYTEADLNAVENMATTLKFIDQYDGEWADGDTKMTAVVFVLQELAKHIADQRKPKVKPAKPAEKKPANAS